MRALFTGAGIASTDPRVRDLGATARIELPAVLAEAGFEAGNVECAAFGSGGVNAELGRQPRPFG